MGNGMYANDLYSYNGIGHISVDYYTLLSVGYGGLKKKVEEKLATIEAGADPLNIKRRIFWEAQLISLEAAMTYFKRYGALAKEQAATCTDPTRKAELEKIASNCEWVSENPARDFWEAMQLWYGATNLILIESNGHSVTYGRLDRIMAPYYAEGSIPRELCQELVRELEISACHPKPSPSLPVPRYTCRVPGHPPRKRCRTVRLRRQ